MAAQLAQRLLPDLRVIRSGLQVEAIEREAAGLQSGVVAGDAVGVQHLTILTRRGFSRGSSRGSLPQGCYLQDCGESDRHHNSTRGNETLHGWQTMLNQSITEISMRQGSLLSQLSRGWKGPCCRLWSEEWLTPSGLQSRSEDRGDARVGCRFCDRREARKHQRRSRFWSRADLDSNAQR